MSIMLEEKWECNGTVYPLFIEFKKATVFLVSLKYPGK
jgi:hypothetical protein